MRTSTSTSGADAASGNARPADVRDLLPFRLSRVAALLDRSGHGHLVSRHGITLSEWRVLALIAATSPASFSHIAQLALIDKGQLSRTIARLAELGWVASERTRENKRNVELRLTAEGRRQYGRIFDFMAELNSRTLARFSEAEQRTFLSMLDRLDAYVEKARVGSSTAAARRPATRSSETEAGRK